MKLEDFRKLVKEEFGQGLQHATPANVRDFVERIDNESLPSREGGRFVINEPCKTYEEVLKDFFAQILELPPEEAMVALYALALDLAFAGIESFYSEKFERLFHDIDQLPPL